jgi:membrane protease YdiL (CAAX protease family)
MRQPKPLNSGHWYSELFFALAILVAAWALSIVTAVLAVDFGLPRVVPRAHVEITNFELAAAYGITWCFAVAFEEVLFRVYLQSKLESLMGETILPVLISAAVFAAGHGYPPRGTLQVFTFGVLFGVIYRMTFRLPRLMLAHWLWDFLTAVLRWKVCANSATKWATPKKPRIHANAIDENSAHRREDLTRT